MANQAARLAFRLYGDPLRAAVALRRTIAALSPAVRHLPRRAVVASGRLFLHPYFPGFPSAAFDRCIERELDRSTPVLGRPPALRAAIVAITRRCALRCEHCLEWDVLNRAEGLTAEELRAMARQLRERGVDQVFLSGGEPLRRFDVVLDLTASLADGTDVWVLSSGHGLSADRAARLRRAGLTGVVLSLDHWDPAAHDRFRGRPGAFAAVRRASAAAREAGLVVALSLCPARHFATRGNLARYTRLARSLGASFIHIYDPRAVGRYDGLDVELGPAEQHALDRWMDEVNRSAGARALPTVTYLGRYGRRAGCGGATEYAFIDTDGALHPCPFCRGHGIPLLGRGLDAALADLRATGCPARNHHLPVRIPA
jgi:MoaA/NifB/PqqE/SkfB family radical SAM enzyme